MRDIPPLPDGFNAVYRCKNHPERDAVAPIACRRCEECRYEALHNYAEVKMREEQQLRHEGRPEHDWTPDGVNIDSYRRREARGLAKAQQRKVR